MERQRDVRIRARRIDGKRLDGGRAGAEQRVATTLCVGGAAVRAQLGVCLREGGVRRGGSRVEANGLFQEADRGGYARGVAPCAVGRPR
jgi:hypothetical protein